MKWWNVFSLSFSLLEWFVGRGPAEWHVLCESLLQEPDWSHVIDVQLKAIKVFCLLVNFPFSRPVRAAPKPWALWTGLMVGLKSVLGSRRGDEGGVPSCRWPDVPLLIRAAVSTARWPAVGSVWQRAANQHSQERLWKESISKWDHLGHLNNYTLRWPLIFHPHIVYEN